jgi:hypothetical protein
MMIERERDKRRGKWGKFWGYSEIEREVNTKRRRRGRRMKERGDGKGKEVQE